MDKNTNRPRNIRLPENIWDATPPHQLRDSETICEKCWGYGGHDHAKNGTGLIEMCSRCRGKGYLDWIDRAKGEVNKEFTYFTASRHHGLATIVEKGKEREYLQKVTMQYTGTFRFKSKDKI